MGGRGTSVEENVAAVEAALEALNAHDWDRFAECHAQDLVQHEVGFEEPIRGRQAIREFLEIWGAAFPDLHVRKERIFGQGDYVCLEMTTTGTHRGPLPGPDGEEIPATNRRLSFRRAAVLKMEDGKIKENRPYYDRMEVMEQLGLL